MNNKIIMWVIVAVVALGAVWYLLSGYQGGIGGVPAATTTPSVQTGAQSTTGRTTQRYVAPPKTEGTGPLTNLFSLKQPLVCTVKTMSGYKRSGTMYVAESKMRANFTSTSMIDDGKYLYVWSIGATKGLKLLAGASVSGSAIATAGGFDPAIDLSYSCNPWKEDASVFTPPTSVSFSNTL